jgi:hypothetical protein
MEGKKYKCEIWKYHIKIDEFESDNPYAVNHWFNKNYKQADEWGECSHYFYTNGVDVEQLREEQYEEMMDTKSSIEPFTLDDKLQLLKIFIAHSTLSAEVTSQEQLQYKLTVNTKLNASSVTDLYLHKLVKYILREQMKICDKQHK